MEAPIDINRLIVENITSIVVGLGVAIVLLLVLLVVAWRRARSRGMDVAVAGDATAPLSVRAAHEYAYVARDVRRIGLTAGLMFAILAGIWVVVNIGGAGLP